MFRTIHRSRRRLLVGALALALPFASVALLAAPAQAKGTFSGPATGTVTCTGVSLKVKFSPKLTATTGGSAIKVTGKLTSCNVSGSTDTISSGKIKGTLPGTGTGCAGLASGNPNVLPFTVKWKGTHNGGKAKFTDSTLNVNGDVADQDGSGNVGFELPDPSMPPGGNVTGSFASSSIPDESHAYTTGVTQSSLTAQCFAKKGVSKLTIDHGTITIP